MPGISDTDKIVFFKGKGDNGGFNRAGGVYFLDFNIAVVGFENGLEILTGLGPAVGAKLAHTFAMRSTEGKGGKGGRKARVVVGSRSGVVATTDVTNTGVEHGGFLGNKLLLPLA